ncbi:MAG: hypothetical protein ACOCV1_07650 [Bacillota bacterium]
MHNTERKSDNSMKVLVDEISYEILQKLKAILLERMKLNLLNSATNH